MPKIWPILAQGFTDVFQRLGIQAVPAGNQWFLSDTLIPVSLVDSDITLSAIVQPAAETVSTAGLTLVPVAGAILATTGQLALGVHTFRIVACSRDGVDNRMTVQHRDAADAVTLNAQSVCSGVTNGQVNFTWEFTIAIALNERVRIVVDINAAAGSFYSATIYHRLQA